VKFSSTARQIGLEDYWTRSLRGVECGTSWTFFVGRTLPPTLSGYTAGRRGVDSSGMSLGWRWDLSCVNWKFASCHVIGIALRRCVHACDASEMPNGHLSDGLLASH
jgi:hypothetical protein